MADCGLIVGCNNQYTLIGRKTGRDARNGRSYNHKGYIP